ncbi:ABC transporter permease subunit [Nocardioides sp. Kera G14]|uniref:ABC transporter permease subunit n=1 Tax=Nocardioides sp. Kera G14 TaxID=2884264 RepID=UPI001D0F909A|nr:ABC transporter permease subunit [Nocardioides sp. Kera G14]UDY22780.1 ABC transporter permease subunit [Nocardioides sp. Kera G14]
MNQTQTLAPQLPDADETPVPFSRLLGVEFRKAWDTKAGFWLIAVIGLLVAIAEVIVLIVSIVNNDSDASWGNFTAVAAFITSVLLPVLGIMLVTTEWTQRTAMVTFTLESRRSRVVLAKLLVGVLLTVATIVLALVVGAVCNLIFTASGGEAVWWDQEFTDGLIGFAITQTLAMFTGFALAALLLNTAASIVVFFAYRYVVPGLIALGAANIGWIDKLAPWINFLDAQQYLYELSEMTGKQWAHFVVSALIWVGIPLALGLRRILKAEVK